MLQTIELLPGITLRCFPHRRFKQNCLSLQFVCPLCEEEAAMNALIPAVLLRGTKSAPDLRAITLRLDDLYGASVGTLVRKVGDYQTTGLYCSFISDRYTLEGDALFAPMVDFLRELMTEPLLADGVFVKALVESEKKNLIASIESQMNNKRTYAMTRMMQTMCKADPFGVPRLGRVESVKKITPSCLYSHYQKILRESRIDLFYVGELPAEQVAARLQLLFRDLTRDYRPLIAQTAFRAGPKETLTETMDVSQGKLVLGLTTPITLRDPDFAAMQVCNTLFGGGMTAKLFMQIREKMSLCYDIGSGYHGSKGIVAVAAGIDCSKDALVTEQILAQLRACQTGDITAQELTAAKESLLNSLRGIHDSPGAIENYYASGALSGLSLTPEEYARQITAVTVADAARVAQTLQLHTVYFLKGVS